MGFGSGRFGEGVFGAADGGGPIGVEVYTPFLPLRIRVVAGEVVRSRLFLRIAVTERYTPTLGLAINVHRPRYTPTLGLRIKVFKRVSPVLGLAINVTGPVVLPSPPAGAGVAPDVWAVQVTVGGVDVSARVTGRVEVEADEGAARIAHVALAPAGVTVALASLARQAVTISFQRVDAAGVPVGTWRLFTGVVDTPEYDPDTRVIRLTCSDARQAKVAAMTRAQIDAMTPGAVWSPHVFDRYATPEQYLNDRVSTLAGTVEGDEYGALAYSPWAGNSSRTLTQDKILDGSLRPQLAGAASARRLSLRLTYQRPQVIVRGIAFGYESPSLTDQFYLGLAGMTRQAVEQALTGSGATLASPINFSPYPTATVIERRGVIQATPAVAASLCLGAVAMLNRRYSRWVRETTVVEVAHGTEGVRTEAQRVVSVEWDQTDSDTRRPPTNAVTAFYVGGHDGPLPYIAPRIVPGETIVDYVPEGQPGGDEWALAYRAQVRAAAREVAESLRGSTIDFSVPLDPRLTLRTFAEVDVPVCSGAGKVTHVRHVMDIDAGMAITSAAVECVSVTFPEIAAPVRPIVPTEIAAGRVSCRAGTFIGGMDGSPPYDEANMIGLCTNANIGTVRPGAERYPETFSVFVPGIEEAAQGTIDAPPTAVLRAGSAVIEALTSTEGFAAGVGISGMGISPGTTVLSVSTSTRTAQLSAPVSINAADVEVRVASRRYITPARVTYSPTIVRNGPNVGA